MNQKKLSAIAVCLLTVAFNTFVYGQSSPSYLDNMRGGNTFAADINGRPLYQKTEYKADGSPYLTENYCSAEVTTTGGRVYKDVKIKINLMERLVLYMDSAGNEMEALTPIKRIKVYNYVQDGVAINEVILQSHNSPLNSAKAPVYVVLEDGAAKLFKQITITFNDERKYGESTVTRTFKKDEVFYALLPGQEQVKKIERNKSSVAAIFESKKDTILSYIEKQKLKCRSEQDLIEVFKYYNSIAGLSVA